MPEGIYPYTVTKDGYNQYNSTINVETDDINEEVALLPNTIETYEVIFSVMNQADSSPINDAQITTNNQIIITDTNGFASINLPDGDYDYSVVADGFENYSNSFSVNGESVNVEVLLNDATFVNSLLENGITIYPNPTNGMINFESDGYNIKKLTIFDVTGKTLIKRTEIQQNEIIDLSSFENGIYIISIQTDNEIFTTKIIKD